MVESIAQLIAELADHEDIRELLVEKGAAELLVFAKARHVANEVS